MARGKSAKSTRAQASKDLKATEQLASSDPSAASGDVVAATDAGARPLKRQAVGAAHQHEEATADCTYAGAEETKRSVEVMDVGDGEEEEKGPVSASQLAPATQLQSSASLALEPDVEDEDAAYEAKLLAEVAALVKDAATQEFPRDKEKKNASEIPMQYQFNRDRFFVRECYAPYYDLVVKNLRDEEADKGVTITGTPGIGKSLFLVYFFSRLVKEDDFKDATVTFAAYNKTSGLRKVAVARVSSDGSNFSIRSIAGRSEVTMLDFVAEEEDEARRQGHPCIRLCDGPPADEPQDVPYLVCTSPNEVWLSKVANSVNHTCYYMPLWTREELFAAAVALELNVESKSNPHPLSLMVIEQLFAEFGGVARACLCVNPDFLRGQRRRLTEPLRKATDANKLERLFQEKENPDTHHRIYHYVPTSDDWSAYTPKLASPYVEQLVIEAIMALKFDERMKLMQWLDSAASTKSTTGRLFEVQAHEVLFKQPTTLRARRLLRNDEVGDGDPGDVVEFQIEACEEKEPCFYKSAFALSDFPNSGPYFIPQSKVAASIDAFYYPGARTGKSNYVTSRASGRGSAESTASAGTRAGGGGAGIQGGSTSGGLVGSENERARSAAGQVGVQGQRDEQEAPAYKALLFQMTNSTHHPEKASGLENVLTRLKLLNVKAESREPVALVFVVPRKDGIAASFQRQKIVADAWISGLDPSESVTKIHGIGPERAKKLAEFNIKTVGEFQEAVDKKLWKKFKRVLENHLKRAPYAVTLLKLLDDIPQYVCEL